VQALELAPDLWRWTGRRDTIGAEVASVYYKTGREILLFDPLLPPEDPEGFWRALDRDVLPVEADVHVLVTGRSHTRSAREMLSRYPGSRIWATSGARSAVARGSGAVPDTIEPGGVLPGGVAAQPSGRPDEVAFWIAEHRAIVVGDVLVGDGSGGLKLGRGAGAREVEALRPLVELEPALVLPSHGEPPDEAGAALRAVLG
jgi:hypothetical protein